MDTYKVKKYMWNILISIDQFFNVLLGGSPDETISSRLGKWKRKYKDNKNIRYYIAIVLGFWLNKIDSNHLNKSIEDDEGNNNIIE